MPKNNTALPTHLWARVLFVVAIFFLMAAQTLYPQIVRDLHVRELRAAGQTTMGTLLTAKRQSIDFVPTGYVLRINYGGGEPKDFTVSKDVFYTYVTHNDNYFVGQRISISWMPDHPAVAEVQAMLEPSAGWVMSLIHYAWGLLCLCMAGSVVFKARQLQRART